MAFYIQSLGEIVILAIIVGILFGVNVNASAAVRWTFFVVFMKDNRTTPGTRFGALAPPLSEY